jgi:ABC-type multidrug transport system ATPase subunit
MDNEQSTPSNIGLQCRSITKVYASAQGATSVFKDLNLEFTKPKTQLVGSNGSGKSTLLRLIAGLEPLSAGQLVWSSPVSIALASESVIPPDIYKANEVLSLVERYQDVDIAYRQTLVDELHFASFLHNSISELSSGSLKKLLLISALSQRSSVLLLDEPFANLDADSRDVIKTHLESDTRFSIIVDHHCLMGELPALSLDSASLKGHGSVTE